MAIEEAETKIRQVAKDEFFKQTRKTAIDKKVFAIVRDVAQKIHIPSLRRAAEASLLEFYERQYSELRRSFSWQLFVVTALALLSGRRADGTEIKPTTAERSAAWRVVENAGYTGARTMGVSMQKFSDEYMRKNVQPALDRLAAQFPYDPDQDPTGLRRRNSLRNRAEFEVRGQAQQDTIDGFKARGVKLVICSTHADCSERCRPWQGRVYSLDGTRGRTDDGREYVPLEEATDIYYVTKAGRQWKNGLLGFNCRHFLVEYKKGYYFPKPNALEERKEYIITQTQRRLEENVRKWRTIAVENKGVDLNRYKEARAKAIEWNKKYIGYSKANDRAFYPSRTALL